MKYLFIFQHRYTEDYFNNSDIEKLSCVKIKLLKMQIYQKKKKENYRKFDFNIENNCYDLNQVINIINVVQL